MNRDLTVLDKMKYEACAGTFAISGLLIGIIAVFLVFTISGWFSLGFLVTLIFWIISMNFAEKVYGDDRIRPQYKV